MRFFWQLHPPLLRCGVLGLPTVDQLLSTPHFSTYWETRVLYYYGSHLCTARIYWRTYLRAVHPLAGLGESTDSNRRAAPYLHHACGDGDTPLEQIRAKIFWQIFGCNLIKLAPVSKLPTWGGGGDKTCKPVERRFSLTTYLGRYLV